MLTKAKTTYKMKKCGAITSSRPYEAGALVSTGKKELADIEQHFSIQINNLLVVLDQDSAKRFLHDNGPREKYTFFERTTRIETCELNLQKQCTQLKEVKKANEMKVKEKNKSKNSWEEWKEKKQIVDEINTFDQTEFRLILESIWAEVLHNESQTEGLRKDLADKKSQATNTEAFLVEAEQYVKDKVHKIEMIAKDVNGFEASVEEIEDARKQVKDQCETLDDDIEEYKKTIQASLKNIEELTKKKDKFVKDLEKEKKRLAEDSTQAEINECEKDIIDIRKKLDEEERTTVSVQAELDAIESESDKYVKKLENARKRELHATANLRKLEGELKDLKKQTDKVDASYGRNCRKFINFLSRSDTARHYKNVPVGPLGAHLTLKDIKWASVIEQKLIGSYMHAFIVSDKSDEALLKKHAQKEGFYIKGPILTYKDFTGSRVDHMNDRRADRANVQNLSSFQPIVPIDILETSKDVVFNMLLQSTSLNSVAFINNPSDAKSAARIASSTVRYVYSMDGQQFTKSRNWKRLANNQPRYFVEDMTALVRQKEQEILAGKELAKKALAAYKSIDDDNAGHQNQIKQIRNKLNTNKRRKSDLEYQLANQKRRKEGLEENRPSNRVLENLEDEINHLEEQIKQRDHQMSGQNDEVAVKVKNLETVVADKLAPLEKKLKSNKDQLKKCKESLNQFVEDKRDKEDEIRKRTKSKDKLEKQVQEAEAKYKENVATCELTRRQAQESGDCPAEVRSPKEVDKALKKLRDRKDRAEGELEGLTSDQVMDTFSTLR